ncbi:MAG: peptidylprolyl isomerase [Hylemonella sp.]|uniref:peptidylprolyl isomerase n=1 Tax=Hylemonella sp. TaxID=2066020 RepID=UPI0022C6C610|nr:peptidylprolyl isomerase [Hylemonella sp.]MCZ8251903.1 peptidylprolyl isomerase [Hylemonella sp.]
MNLTLVSGLRRGLLLAATALFAVSVAQAQGAAAPRVKLATSAGDIVLELQAAKAPKSVENFLAYVKKGHYNGTIFHRVIPGFMIQGGGFDKAMAQKPTEKPIENEATNGLKNDKYTVAMARTPHPHSASAQFFINVNDNAFLNHSAPTQQGWGYAVFGRVVEGQDVVDKIAAVPTGNQGMHQNVPLTPVIINAATVLP